MSEYKDSRKEHGSSEGYRGGDPRPPLPTKGMMGSRIYVGKLPPDIREREVEKVFSKFGRIKEIALKGNYCFIQYEGSRGAKDAVYEMNDRSLYGDRIQVEHARTPKEFGFRAPSSRGGGYGYSSRGYSGGYSGGGGRYGSSNYSSSRSYSSGRRSPPVRSDYKLAVTNLSTRCDGQDLKEVMSKAGEVVYTDAHRRRVGEGVIEFASRKDMERALKKLDGLEINGKPIKLEIQEGRKTYRSKSRSASRSKSRSRSASGSPSRKKRRRSSSRSASEEGSGGDEEPKNDDKSDDEEFEEAERSVKQKRERRKQAGAEGDTDSESGHDYDVVNDEGTQKDKEGSVKKDVNEAAAAGDDDDDEDVEEIEVEEEVIEEVEVDDDEQEGEQTEEAVKIEEQKEENPAEREEEMEEDEPKKSPEKPARAQKQPARSTRRSSRRSAGKAPAPNENGDDNEDE